MRLPAVLLCVLALVPRAAAQTAPAADRACAQPHYHADEYEPVALSRDALERALVALKAKAYGLQPKAGPLDLDGLTKAIDAGLTNLKPDGKLRISTWANCTVVDPHDAGGYWEGYGSNFDSVGEKDQPLALRWDAADKAFSLTEPPRVSVRYSAASRHLADPRQKPYGKDVEVVTEVQGSITIWVTFDGQLFEDGKPRSVSGVGGGNLESSEFRATVSLTDMATR